MVGPAPLELSRRDARRVAIAAQGLAAPRPAGRIDRRHFRTVLDRLATVQIDSVNVLTRSHELVFFSRLGAYDRDALTRWLWASREVFEYGGHEASLHPVARYPLLRWRMAGSHAWGGVRRAARDNPELVAAALSEIAARGPVPIGDLDVNRQHPRHEGAWWGWGQGKAVVEHLLPMAKDNDVLVRRLVVDGLKDFKQATVVDVLLVALADPADIVADTAWRSLKDMTGQKMPFDAKGSREERSRAQKVWRDWWDKNRNAFGS